MPNKYAVGTNNQLLIAGPSGNREPIPGVFAIRGDNTLMYLVDRRFNRSGQYSTSPRIIFEGSWRLNRENNLEFLLQKNNKQDYGVLTLRGSIISVKGDTLSFESLSYDYQGNLQARILTLSGVWLADDRNRITFTVKKRVPDVLVFACAWQVNKDQKVVYTFERTQLKSKKKISETLLFEGYWQIRDARRLSYILEGSTSSRFDFKVQLETPSIYPKAREIRYRIGIGLRRRVATDGIIIPLYGTWKIGRNYEVSFLVEYGRGRLMAMEFGAIARFRGTDEVELSLRSSEHNSVGITLIATRRFLKKLDAKAFLRLESGVKESRALAGVTIPF